MHTRYTRSSNSYKRKNQPKRVDTRLFVNKAKPITISDSDSTVTFQDFQFESSIQHILKKREYIQPTPIQKEAIPYILAGKDVIGIANTGTGKTAAFLLPLIQKLYENNNERALVVAPTRELALQIIQEFHLFAKALGIRAVLCIGGDNIKRQEKELRGYIQLVIGTPGRLKDLINRKSLNLTEFHTVVLDEVDRMVDIGFIHDMRFLISHMPRERQSLFFSATVDKSTQSILEEFVTNPVTVSVKKQETAGNVEQNVIKVRDRFEKLEILEEMLRKDAYEKVLIFGRTKWGIEKLSKHLLSIGFKVASIHGNKSQNQRQRALQLFKQNQLQALLATDIASRGLDIDNITHVINYDAPDSHESYVHRIGRTGRANNTGIALTFVEDPS